MRKQLENLILKYELDKIEMNNQCNKHMKNSNFHASYHDAGVVYAIKLFISDLKEVLKNIET